MACKIWGRWPLKASQSLLTHSLPHAAATPRSRSGARSAAISVFQFLVSGCFWLEAAPLWSEIDRQPQQHSRQHPRDQHYALGRGDCTGYHLAWAKPAPTNGAMKVNLCLMTTPYRCALYHHCYGGGKFLRRQKQRSGRQAQSSFSCQHRVGYV